MMTLDTPVLLLSTLNGAKLIDMWFVLSLDVDEKLDA